MNIKFNIEDTHAGEKNEGREGINAMTVRRYCYGGREEKLCRRGLLLWRREINAMTRGDFAMMYENASYGCLCKRNFLVYRKYFEK